MPKAPPQVESERLVLGVGQLIAGLKGLLEDQVGQVWVAGEISNLHRAASGHCYFTLKDEDGQMRAAFFRGQARRLRFDLEEGLEVVVGAEVSIYAARGDLQLIVRSVEPRGVGALQLAFEQLRKRLQAAGLFDESRKRPIPEYPRRIGLVTSPTSAAVRDVLKVAGRRFPATPILISPTLVQGDEAPEQVAKAIERLAAVEDVDVILVVRGGGSLEDLWAFNTEIVAHAIANARAPVISGVGHETDVTIADLVADLRSATPSAAAMQALPDREALRRLVGRDLGRLFSVIERRVAAQALRLARLRDVLRALGPQARIASARARELRAWTASVEAIRKQLDRRRRQLVEAAARLDALSPLAVLGRGYAIVRDPEAGRIVRSADELHPGERIDVRFARGRVAAEVTRVDPEDPSA
jgi:exodeoxyribonuclease VII large subunit